MKNLGTQRRWQNRPGAVERCKEKLLARGDHHEAAARAAKVAGLCLAIERFSADRGSPVRAADVLKWSDDAWEIFAWACGITTPSITTRTAVLDRLVERDAQIASNNAELARLAARR